MTEKQLIEKGWRKGEPVCKGDKSIWYNDKLKSKYGRRFEHAVETQEQLDALDTEGVHWKMIPERNGFGFRVMFLWKGTKIYRLYGIYENEEHAKKVAKECAKLFKKDNWSFTKDTPVCWHDNSKVNKLLTYKGHYGHSNYLVTSYSQLAKICFKFLKKYFDENGDWEGLDTRPEEPSVTVEQAPKEFKEQTKKLWEDYNREKDSWDERYKETERFGVIQKNWEKQWHEFAAEVIETTLQNYSNQSLVLEDFSDPENIADD